MEDKKQEIIEFTYNLTGFSIDDMETNFEELGIDGFEAEQFFVEFGKKFNIDMKGFNFNRYFSNENIFVNIRFGIRYINKTRSFNFNHLVQVVDKGSWFDRD